MKVPRSFVCLSALVLLGHLGDYSTTLWLMRRGGLEGNPLAAWFLDHDLFLAWKLLGVVALVALLWRYRSSRFGVALGVGLTAAIAAVVANNCFWIGKLAST
ncbi:hypothetical protein DB347_17790 [Opitutaceae bacterium EW11]|nr:hypothetical protein DB347_17790 [Opitutaceae bacterium EW11]